MLANSARCLHLSSRFCSGYRRHRANPSLHAHQSRKTDRPIKRKVLTRQSILIRGGIVEAVGPGLTAPRTRR